MQPTPNELRKVANYMIVNSRRIAMSEVTPRGDGFGVDALAFDIRKVAEVIDREAIRQEAGG